MCPVYFVVIATRDILQYTESPSKEGIVESAQQAAVDATLPAR